MSIKVKFLGILAGTMLLAGIATVSLWSSSMNRLLDEYVRSFTEQLMDKTEVSLVYIINDLEHALFQIVSNTEIMITPLADKDAPPLKALQYNRAMMEYIRMLYSSKYYLQGISVVSKEGKVYSAGASARDPQVLYAYLENTVWEEKITLLPLIQSNQSDVTRNTKVIPLARPILDYSGNIVGYGVIYFNTQLVTDLMESNFPQGTVFSIKDRWGELIFSNEPDGSTAYDTSRGEYNLFTHETPKLGWESTIAMPVQAITDEIMPIAVQTAIIYAVIYLAAFGSVIVFTSRITSRILRINAAMDTVAKGDLTVRIREDGCDEISMITAGLNTMVQQITTLIENVKIQEKCKQQTELDFLQAQINPHFLVNTLNTIVWMANMQGSSNISGLSTSLIGLLSGTMKRGKEMIPLTEELRYIDYYADMQKYRYLDKFEIHCEPSADTEQAHVLRFILQPVVENALLHGIDPLENRSGVITISANREADQLVIRVRDNGVGIPPDRLEQLTVENSGERGGKTFSSIGVHNVHERLQLMFGEEYGISFESKLGEYTIVTLRMPLLYDDDNIDMM